MLHDHNLDRLHQFAVWWQLQRARLGGRLSGDGGEGVVSAAIAVLIFALLGLAMWVGFELLFDDTTERTRQAVEQTGR